MLQNPNNFRSNSKTKVGGQTSHSYLWGLAVDSRSISLRQMACSVWWRCPCLGRQSAGRSCSWGMWYLDAREANLNWLLFEFENGWTCLSGEINCPLFFASLLPLRWASKTSCALPTSWNSGWIHAAPLWRTWYSSPWECHRFKEHQRIRPFAGIDGSKTRCLQNM